MDGLLHLAAFSFALFKLQFVWSAAGAAGPCLLAADITGSLDRASRQAVLLRSRLLPLVEMQEAFYFYFSEFPYPKSRAPTRL